MMNSTKSRSFTLLEVLIGVSLIAIASGALFLRLNRMLERKQFDSDLSRLKSTLLSTRSLAINTKMDFRLELRNTEEGWNARLICREDPDLIYPLPRFSSMKINFEKKTVQEFFVDFFSSGFVGPKGVLELSNDLQKFEFTFPEFFYRKEPSRLKPIHPAELNNR
jgi:type II secretory pathway component PulJ